MDQRIKTDSRTPGCASMRGRIRHARAHFRAVSETSAVAPLPPKVLVVDDDPNITAALGRRLGALGIEVIGSHHAKEGMLLALREKPDVIITDYKMPEISGERLMMNLKYNDLTKNIPVIMITGVTIDGKQDFALKRQILGPGGAVSFLSKPIVFETLLDELQRHIEFPERADTTGDDGGHTGVCG